MQTSIDIWNILHDGTIVKVSGTIPGDLLLKVEIQCLCGALATNPPFLYLHLHVCERLQYLLFNSPEVVEDIAELNNFEIEILSATNKGDYVEICCVDGMLKLLYKSLSCKLNDNITVTLDMLRKAAKEYWKNQGKLLFTSSQSNHLIATIY